MPLTNVFRLKRLVTFILTFLVTITYLAGHKAPKADNIIPLRTLDIVSMSSDIFTIEFFC